MRSGAAWHDVCILNVSKRGMLLQAADPPLRGAYLEIRRGALIVVAQVMWAKTHRFGVKTQDILPVEALVADVEVPIVGDGIRLGEQRRRPRLPPEQHSRQQGRVIEYGFAAGLAIAVAGFAASQVYAVLASPAKAITAALSGNEMIER